MNKFEFFEHVENDFTKRGLRQDISDGVENILIVRGDNIGDFVVSSGFIREVRANFPKAYITLVVSPLVYPLAELCPYVNEIFSFNARQYTDISVMAKLVDEFCSQNFRNKHFTLALSPQWGSKNFPNLLMAYLSGAKTRIGYGTFPYKSWLGEIPKGSVSDFDNILLTDVVITPREIISECEKCLYLLSAAGLKINSIENELWYSKADVFKAWEFLKFLPSNRKKVVVGIGAGANNRKYPVDKWATAINQIADDNLAFVIVGGESEIREANSLMGNIPNAKALNLVNRTTLRETAAIISQMDFYIGNDSGVMHMAAAEKIPCLVVYRDAQSKQDYLPGCYSESRCFPPWMTKSVIIRPEHPLGDCAEKPVYGWCRHKKAHCIAQIPPEEIVEGFAELVRIANLPEE